MYIKEKSLILRSSASSVPNNLCCYRTEANGDVHIAVIHKNLTNIILLNKQGEQSFQVCSRRDSTSLILQAKWFRINNNLLLVIASQEGVQIYDNEGTLLHWHSFSNQEDTLSIDSFARGITLVNDSLCVGTHEGIILAFKAKTVDSLSKEQPLSLKFHTAAITHLCSANGSMVSADNDGCICIWKAEDGTMKKVHSFDAFGSPCTSVAMWQEMLVSGFSSGHLRVFSLPTRKLCTEVVAHARPITSVDIAPASGLALTASEDSFIRIWQLVNEVKMKSIEFRCTILVPDCQLCGACFFNDTGTKIGTTAYDSEEIVCYKLTE